MDSISVLLLAIGLAMDAFAVSVCKGLAIRTPKMKQILIIAVWFGSFQAIMPIIGYYLGSSFHQYISQFDYIVAFALLFLIGANMIREALGDEEEDNSGDIGFKIMFLLAIATSIDALAAGISLAMDDGGIFLPALIIGIVTFLISATGVKLGSLVGDKLSGKAEILGGVILILLGFKILIEHSGLL